MTAAPISDDDPVTLAEACELVFRNKIKVATLRREAERGTLVRFRVGRRDFTTLRDVREMIKRCHDAGEHHAFTSTRGASNGSCGTAQSSSALAG